MTRGTAQQTAENITAPFVGRENTVADHEDGRADMVGNNTQRNVGLFVFFILYARNAADVLHDVLHGIDLKEVVYPLGNAGKTL